MDIGTIEDKPKGTWGGARRGPRHRPWSSADSEKFKKLWLEGATTSRIAKTFKRKKGWVSGKSIALNLPKRGRGAYRAIKYDPDVLRAMWENGDKLSDIANHFKTTTCWVSRTCIKKLGLPKRQVRNRDIPTTPLVAAYQNGMSLKDIGKKVGICQNSVRLRIESEGVKIRKAGHCPHDLVTPESLEQVKALIVQGLTFSQIAKKLGRDRGWVDYRSKLLRKGGFSFTYPRAKRDDITPELVLDLFDNQYYSVADIAVQLKCSKPTVRQRLRTARAARDAENNESQV